MIIAITRVVQTVVDLVKEKFSAHSGIGHKLNRASLSELKHQVLACAHVKILHLKGKAKV